MDAVSSWGRFSELLVDAGPTWKCFQSAAHFPLVAWLGSVASAPQVCNCKEGHDARRALHGLRIACKLPTGTRVEISRSRTLRKRQLERFSLIGSASGHCLEAAATTATTPPCLLESTDWGFGHGAVHSGDRKGPMSVRQLRYEK